MIHISNPYLLIIIINKYKCTILAFNFNNFATAVKFETP